MPWTPPAEEKTGGGGGFVPPPQEMQGGGAAVRPVAASMAYQEAGAPYIVRAAVGAARPRDRLATIRKWYPDAEPVAGDNFIYTDPATGKRTLYNPPNLDRGDWFAIGREAAQMVGGAAGTALGTPSGPGGAIAGGILGSAAGDQAIDWLLRISGIGPSGGVASLAKDAGGDLANAAGGEAAGVLARPVLTGAARMLSGAVDRSAAYNPAAVLDATDALGLPPPTPGMVGNRMIASVENTQDAMNPLSVSRARGERLAQGVADRLETAVADPANPGRTVAASANPATAMQAGGEAGARAAKTRLDVFRRRQQIADAAFEREINKAAPGMRFSIDSVRNLRNTLQTRIAESPEMRGKMYAGTLEFLNDIISDADAAGGRVPVKLIREWRTEIGQAAFDKATAERLKVDQVAMRDLYSALRTDIQDAAQLASPRAAWKLRVHDSLVTRFNEDDAGTTSISDQLSKLMETGTYDGLYRAIKSGSTKAVTSIMQHARPEDRAILARSVLDEMMQQKDGRIDPLKWGREWRAMPPGVRRELFGRTVDLDAMDQLATVVAAMRNKASMKNFSNTANSLDARDAARTLGAIAAGTLGLQAVDLPTMLTMLGAPMVMDAATANPAVSRWFAASIRRMGNGQPAAPMPEPVREILRQVTTKAAGREATAAALED